MDFIPASDSSLLVRLASEYSPEAQHRTLQLFRSIQRGPVRGVLSLSPAYLSILIRFDPLVTGHDALTQFVLEAKADQAVPATPRTHHLPVLYDGPDLFDIAFLHHLSCSDVVDLHSSPVYTVCFLGFLPGFAYMGDVASELMTPRRATPRSQVPAGSVGIANRNTGIYPVSAPGGWHLLGRCPVKLFDFRGQAPTLLSPGDTVRFHPINAAEFDQIAG